MAVYDLEEQERLDALKDWWDRNRVTILSVIGVVVVVLGGYYGWKTYQNQQNIQAEALHKEFGKLVGERDAKKISGAATVLIEKYPSTFFATDAALAAAKANFDAKDYEGARKHLQWAVDKGKSELRPIAQLRLSMVYLEEKKYDDALKTVEGVKEDAYLALASDLKGDILLSKGAKDEARLSYQQAIDKAEARSPLKTAVQVKLDSIGTTGAAK